LRWASDRINSKGVIGFVSNGSFIDGNNMDGLRASLTSEFSSIYVFNLRGNARTSGEQRRMEKGNVFGEGTRTPVAISLFVRNPDKSGRCELHYHDIGNYLSREEKLALIRGFASMNGLHREKKWQPITPNANHDWINQRDPAFEKFVSFGDKKDEETNTIFESYSLGVSTNRDIWVYGFSREAVLRNTKFMVSNFNEQARQFAVKSASLNAKERADKIEQFIDNDPKKVSWSANLKTELGKGTQIQISPTNLIKAHYRPFCTQYLMFDRAIIERPGLNPKMFPSLGVSKEPLNN
jgi:predicted helicase